MIEKYAESCTNYCIKEISEEELKLGQKGALSLDVSKVEQSSKQCGIIFKPGQSVFQGRTRLCLCEEWKNDYGSCDLLDDYTFSAWKVSVPYLQSKNAVFDAEEDWQKVDNECDHYWDFLFRVTVAPDSGSQDPVWLIRIKVNNCIAYSEGLDSYGNKIDAGQWYLKGHFFGNNK